MKSKKQVQENQNASIFAYSVVDPEKYGVIDFDSDMNPIKISEKPKNPKSNYAVVGLYFFPNNVIKIAKK